MRLQSHLPDAIRKSYLRKFALVVLVVLVAVSSLGVYTQQNVSAELTEQRDARLPELPRSRRPTRWIPG